MILLLGAIRFPRIEKNEEEQTGTVDTYFRMLRRGMVWLYFGCVFAYVGSVSGPLRRI